MSRKIEAFIAAFVLSFILIGAMVGFALVDYSTERYMPNQFGPFFEISGITPDKIEYSFLAKNYYIDLETISRYKGYMRLFRGFIPDTILISDAAAGFITSYLIDKYLE